MKPTNAPTGSLRQAFLLILLSSGMLSLCYSRLPLAGLAWISFIPWFYAIAGRSARQRLLLSYCWGFCFFLATIYWLGHVSIAGLILLCAYLALYPLIFGLLSANPGAGHALWTLPLGWCLLEFLRSRLLWGGFGWALLGHSQYRWLSLLQLAEYGGVAAISALVLMMNVAGYRVLRGCRRGDTVIPLLLLLLSVFSGRQALRRAYTDIPYTVSVIQGNIPQEYKHDPRYAVHIMRRFRNLTLQAAAAHPDIIIWPETAVPGDVLTNSSLRQQLTTLAVETGSALIVGSAREENNQVFNSAVYIDRAGTVAGVTDKVRLVPFGEYNPLQRWLPHLDLLGIGDFSAGHTPTLFTVQKPGAPAKRFCVLICFEDIFSDLIRQVRRAGAEFLIIITNEAWFHRGDEARQHLAISVFAAVEHRCWIMRSANTGISAFIDPHGRVRQTVAVAGQEQFVTGYATRQLTGN